MFPVLKGKIVDEHNMYDLLSEKYKTTKKFNSDENKKLTGAELEAREKQVVTFNDGTQMTLPLLTRWALLIEAINLICDEYYERDMEFTVDNIVKKAKPHKAIKKYIDERYFAGLQDLILENNF